MDKKWNKWVNLSLKKWNKWINMSFLQYIFEKSRLIICGDKINGYLCSAIIIWKTKQNSKYLLVDKSCRQYENADMLNQLS